MQNYVKEQKEDHEKAWDRVDGVLESIIASFENRWSKHSGWGDEVLLPVFPDRMMKMKKVRKNLQNPMSNGFLGH